MEPAECSEAFTKDMLEMDALLRMADFSSEHCFLETMLKRLAAQDELPDDELSDDELTDVVAAAGLPQKPDTI